MKLTTEMVDRAVDAFFSDWSHRVELTGMATATDLIRDLLAAAVGPVAGHELVRVEDDPRGMDPKLLQELLKLAKSRDRELVWGD